MFQDRREAGKKLAKVLRKYQETDAIVLAIPRGGVPVGIEIAGRLKLAFSIIVSRKLPFPDSPEAGFGAIAEDGSIYLQENSIDLIPQEIIDEIIERQTTVIRERIANLRNNRPLPDIEGKTVIITDDGIAMGSTMMSAVDLCKNKNAGKIVVAVPVGGPSVVSKLSTRADELHVLVTPPFFRAVAQVYRNWHDLSDQTVIEQLNEFYGNSVT